MKAKQIAFAIFLTVVSIITVRIAIKSCNINPQPTQVVKNEIQKKSDSVAVASVLQPDTIKLRKLASAKYRVAEAQYTDSVERAKNQ